MNTKYRTKFRW